jgi:hypothetical protein
MKYVATACSFLLLCILATPTQASLISNGSFETVPNGSTGEGLLPTGWFHTTPSLPASSRASTFSNNGSYGLDPGEDGAFIGATAGDGIRWVAGVSDGAHGSANTTVAGEAFGTTLTELLVAGDSYQLDALLFQNTNVNLFSADKPGGYQLFLSSTTSGAGAALLGALPMVTSNSWQSRSLTFEAPNDAASRPYLIFVPYWVSFPGGSAYPNSYIGIDDVSLVALSVPSPVPAPSGLVLALSGLGSWLTLRFRLGRNGSSATTN